MLRMHNRFSMMLLACSMGLLICSSSAFAFDGNIQLSPLYSNEIKESNDPSMATPNPTPTLSQPTQNGETDLQPIDPYTTSSNHSSTHNSSVPTPNPAISTTPSTAAIASGSGQTPNITNVDNMFKNDSSLPTPNPVLAPPPIPNSNFPSLQPLTPNVSNSHFGLPSNTPQMSVGYNDQSKPSPNTTVYPPPPPAPPYYARTYTSSTETSTTTSTSNDNGANSTTTTTTSGSNTTSSNNSGTSGNSGSGGSSGTSGSSGSGGSSGTSGSSGSSNTPPGSTPSNAIPSASPVGSDSGSSSTSNTAPTGTPSSTTTPNKTAAQNGAMNYAQALRSCTPGNYTGPSQTTAMVTGNIGMSKAAAPTVTYQIGGIVNGQCQVTMVQQAVTPATAGSNGAINSSISPAATMSKCNFNPNNLNALASQVQQSANGYANATTSANTQSIMSSSCSSYLMAGNAAVPFQSSGNSSNNTVGNLIGKQ